ncbi:hypothetical protein Peur_023226 [Populus x canadensis]|uniref:berberine bridge enzyme-like 24 n=1 Tax=Populus nigra TaxID=3691 RepID=UPI002B26BC79|nr:berberine bridge enzyme-like 24 [Populus nigra]
MDEIPESATPFPHIAGNIIKINYLSIWRQNGEEASKRHIDWIRELYNYTTPYVSQNPREAYINYMDLDIGVNKVQGDTCQQAKIWGPRYYNFEKLATVKSAVDPTNFIRNEQSIPPFSS